MALQRAGYFNGSAATSCFSISIQDHVARLKIMRWLPKAVRRRRPVEGGPPEAGRQERASKDDPRQRRVAWDSPPQAGPPIPNVKRQRPDHREARSELNPESTLSSEKLGRRGAHRHAHKTTP